MWTAFWIGLAVGSALVIPAAWVWGRRIERRVRQLESRARAAERLAEIGTLTSGLAHEIKNPLSTVGLNIQLIREDLTRLQADAPASHGDPDELARIQRRFGALARETDRLREILEDFLRFAGRVKLDLAPTDINAVITELVDFFEPQAHEAKVNLRAQLDADPAVAPADAAHLKQALLNLLINAAQAMTECRDQDTPHGGASELMIRTERKRRRDGRADLLIHVIDTGPGMPPDLAAKVFQPYFSTKRGGTGLGLPTTRRIIEEHGGHITLHAEPGRGSNFTIELPAG